MGLDPHPASGSAGSPGRAADDAVRGSLFDPHLSGSSGRAPVIPSSGDMTGRFWEPLQWGKKKKQLTVSDVSSDLARVLLLPLMMWMCLREECCTRRSSDFPVTSQLTTWVRCLFQFRWHWFLSSTSRISSWQWLSCRLRMLQLRVPVTPPEKFDEPLRSSSFWIWLLTCMQPSKSPSGGRSTPGWSCSSEPRSSFFWCGRFTNSCSMFTPNQTWLAGKSSIPWFSQESLDILKRWFSSHVWWPLLAKNQPNQTTPWQVSDSDHKAWQWPSWPPHGFVGELRGYLPRVLICFDHLRHW